MKKELPLGWCSCHSSVVCVLDRCLVMLTCHHIEGRSLSPPDPTRGTSATTRVTPHAPQLQSYIRCHQCAPPRLCHIFVVIGGISGGMRQRMCLLSRSRCPLSSELGVPTSLRDYDPLQRQQSLDVAVALQLPPLLSS